MSPLWLQIRVTCMLAVFLVLLFQVWNRPGSSDRASDEPKMVPCRFPAAPPGSGGVLHYPCPATASEGGVCTMHAYPFSQSPLTDRLYKPGCMYVNDQEVGCQDDIPLGASRSFDPGHK